MSEDKTTRAGSSGGRRSGRRGHVGGVIATAGAGPLAVLLMAGAAGAATAATAATTRSVEASGTTALVVAHGGGSAQITSQGTVGLVVAVDRASGSFTLRSFSGSKVTVKVTKSTAYRTGKGAGTTLAAVKVGARVTAIGATVHGTETAVIIVIGGPPGGHRFGGFGHGTLGKVRSIDRSAHTFTVRESSGTMVKVKVTSTTTYRDRKKSSASFATITVGEAVAVLGTTSSGTETAKTVIIGLSRFRPVGLGS